MTWIHDLVTAVTFAIVFQLGRYFGHRDTKEKTYKFNWMCPEDRCLFIVESDTSAIVSAVANDHAKYHEMRI